MEIPIDSFVDKLTKSYTKHSAINPTAYILETEESPEDVLNKLIGSGAPVPEKIIVSAIRHPLAIHAGDKLRSDIYYSALMDLARKMDLN
jgi:hypothetical protein